MWQKILLVLLLPHLVIRQYHLPQASVQPGENEVSVTQEVTFDVFCSNTFVLFVEISFRVGVEGV